MRVLVRKRLKVDGENILANCRMEKKGQRWLGDDVRRGGGRWNEKLIRRGVRRESEVFLVASEIRKGLRKGCAKVS